MDVFFSLYAWSFCCYWTIGASWSFCFVLFEFFVCWTKNHKKRVHTLSKLCMIDCSRTRISPKYARLVECLFCTYFSIICFNIVFFNSTRTEKNLAGRKDIPEVAQKIVVGFDHPSIFPQRVGGTKHFMAWVITPLPIFSVQVW